MASNKKRLRKKNLQQVKPLSGQLMGGFVCLLAVSGAWFGDMVSNHMLVKAFFAECGIVLMLCWWCYQNKATDKISVRFSPTRLIAAALFLSGTVSVFWAVNVDFYVFKWLMWLAAAGAFFLALNIDPAEKSLHRLAIGLVIAGVIIAVIGILQYLTAFDLPRSAAAPASTFGNRNMASHVIVLLLPICFYLLTIRTTRISLIWLSTFSASLMLIYIFYATTRAAWVAILVMVIFAIVITIFMSRLSVTRSRTLLHWSKQKTKASVAAVLFTLIMFNLGPQGLTPFWSSMGSNVASIGEAASNPSTRRYDIWRSANDLAKISPAIGNGLGSYFHLKNTALTAEGKTYENIQSIGIQRAHNDLLELLIELGWVGLLLFTAFGVALFYCFCKICFNAHDHTSIFYIAISCALVGTMVNAQFSFPYQVAMPLLIFGLYSGLLVRAADKPLAETKRQWVVAGWFKRVFVTLITITTVFVLVVNLQWFNNYKNINHRVVVEARSEAQRRANPNETGWEKPLILTGWFYHPEYQTLLKDTAKAYFAIKKYPANLNVLRSIQDYWPDSYEINGAFARSYTEMRKFPEVQSFLPKMYAKAPDGDYSTDLLELLIASLEKKKAQELAIYSRLMSEPEERLLAVPVTLQRLHTTAAELKKSDQVHRWYQLYRTQYPPHATMEANEAVVYISLDNDKSAAIPHMKNAIALNPSNPNNVRFNAILQELEH